MSHEHVHVPTREEILAGTSRPLPRSLYTLAMVLAAIGALVFVVGAFMGLRRYVRAIKAAWIEQIRLHRIHRQLTGCGS